MTSFFLWDPARYGLGIAEMDREHETLIRLMNRLHELHAAKAGRAELGKALDALGDCTVKHFRDEEAYMERIGYPNANRHRLLHASLLERFREHARRFHASGELGNDFFYFLSNWLKAHIRGVDARYAGKEFAAA